MCENTQKYHLLEFIFSIVLDPFPKLFIKSEFSFMCCFIYSFNICAITTSIKSTINPTILIIWNIYPIFFFYKIISTLTYYI